METRTWYRFELLKIDNKFEDEPLDKSHMGLIRAKDYAEAMKLLAEDLDLDNVVEVHIMECEIEGNSILVSEIEDEFFGGHNEVLPL